MPVPKAEPAGVFAPILVRNGVFIHITKSMTYNKGAEATHQYECDQSRSAYQRVSPVGLRNPEGPRFERRLESGIDGGLFAIASPHLVGLVLRRTPETTIQSYP